MVHPVPGGEDRTEATDAQAGVKHPEGRSREKRRLHRCVDDAAKDRGHNAQGSYHDRITLLPSIEKDEPSEVVYAGFTLLEPLMVCSIAQQ